MVMYADVLMNEGMISQEYWEKMSDRFDNMVDVEIPDHILREYYLLELKAKYQVPFEEWFYQESVADDMDGLFAFTDWRPKEGDVVWYAKEADGVWYGIRVPLTRKNSGDSAAEAEKHKSGGRDGEMKLMELALHVNAMQAGEVIDFKNASKDVDSYWIGIKRVSLFDEDAPAYVIGIYGGEAEARLYHISEWDERIGEDCEKWLRFYQERKDYVSCVGKMIADYIMECCGEYVNDILTVEFN